MRISDWSSDVCSSDLNALDAWAAQQNRHAELRVSYEQNKQALHAAERGYQEGAADYLNVLAAQRGVLASQTSLNASATNAALTQLGRAPCRERVCQYV